MRTKGRLTAILTALLGMSSPGNAAWIEARTDHFIISADTTEARAREFAVRLERFDAALRRLYNVPDDLSQRANRVLVFAVDRNTVSRLCRGCPSSVAGFYSGSAGRSVIVTSALGVNGKDELNPIAVLLHEYSHHFMYTSAPGAYPMWYSEGFAEFNANVDFKPDGGIVIGLPAQYRAYGLLGYHDGAQTGSLIPTSHGTLTIAQLLDPPRDLARRPVDLDQFYGRSWLLMHYLELSPTRRSQLADYVARFNRGEPSLKAANAAFGDVGQLGRELAGYLAKNQLQPPLLIPPAAAAPSIDIATLSPGSAAMMQTHMRSSVGVTRTEAVAALPAITARTAAFPNDARVQVELAEAAFDAGDDAAAEAAADRAIKIDPNNSVAWLYKGDAALRATLASGRDPARIASARSWIVKANRLEPNAALPLLSYYKSFVGAGQPPSQAATNGLMRAVVLAPEQIETRWLLARHYLDHDDPDSARELLAPIAFSPHAGPDNVARRLVDLLDSKDLASARKLSAQDQATK